MSKSRVNTSRVYAAQVNGVSVQISAFLRSNAVAWFQAKDSKITDEDVVLLPLARHSHQSPVDLV